MGQPTRENLSKEKDLPTGGPPKCMCPHALGFSVLWRTSYGTPLENVSKRDIYEPEVSPNACVPIRRARQIINCALTAFCFRWTAWIGFAVQLSNWNRDYRAAATLASY